MASKKRRYTGKLAAPIKRKPPPTFEGAWTEERVAQFREQYRRHETEADAEVQRQTDDKLQALLEHYGVVDGDFRALALKLADQHVPGFRVIAPGKKRGRKRGWDGPKLLALYEVVEKVKTSRRRTDRQALAFIGKDPEYAKEWGPPKGRDHSAWIETLESRLQDAKSYIARLDRIARLIPSE